MAERRSRGVWDGGTVNRGGRGGFVFCFAGLVSWLNFSPLIGFASWWISEGPGRLEKPPPPPLHPLPALKSLCCEHSCTVHITSHVPLPPYPCPSPPPLMIAEHVPSARQQLFPLHVHTHIFCCARPQERWTHACTDQRARHAPFSFLRFFP